MSVSPATGTLPERRTGVERPAESARTGARTEPSVAGAAPRWSFYWLWAAGIYNLVWGLATIAAPNLLFDLTGIPRVNYPEIWQCVGMIVGVYGIGYIAAAYDSRRHWPIVLVGLLGKIFGPIGFAGALIKGTFPLAFGATILTNDLLWWIPFTLILVDAWRSAQATSAGATSGR